MGNGSSRLCSIDSPCPSPVPSPPSSVSRAFKQRPLLLSTNPSAFKSKRTASDSFTLRARAPTLLLSRSPSHPRPGRASSHQRSASEKRLSPNTEFLIAQEFGIQPGGTKVVSCLPSTQQGRSGTSSSQQPSPPWALESAFPSPDLHLGSSDGGSDVLTAKTRRWSLKDLTRRGRGDSGGRSSLLTSGSGVEMGTLGTGHGVQLPSTSSYDAVLLSRHHLMKTLRAWSVGDGHTTQAELSEAWASMLSLSQAALSEVPGSVKHLARVGDAILTLLAGAGEHAGLIAEVGDGCKEIVDQIRDAVDTSSFQTADLYSPGWTSRISKSFRGRADSSPAPSRRDLEIDTTIEEGPAARLDFVFVPPRPAFLEDESPCRTPALESTSSPSLEDASSPVGPFTPAPEDGYLPPSSSSSSLSAYSITFDPTTLKPTKSALSPSSPIIPPYTTITARPTSFDALLSSSPHTRTSLTRPRSSPAPRAQRRDLWDPTSPNPSQAGTFGCPGTSSSSSRRESMTTPWTKGGGGGSSSDGTSASGWRYSGVTVVGMRGERVGGVRVEEEEGE